MARCCHVAHFHVSGLGDKTLPAAGAEREALRFTVLDIEDQLRVVPRGVER
jgi:hypothetical protein